MIKIHKNWKLLKTFDDLDIKNMNHIKSIFTEISQRNSFSRHKIPPMCEEPMQYQLRKNWYILLPY